MRESLAVLLLAVALIGGLAVVVEAGAVGAVKVDLQTADFYKNPAGDWRTNPVDPVVGKVKFSPTNGGTLNVTVQVKDGHPSTTFECYLIPPDRWTPDGDRHMVTLNKKGKGTIHFKVDMWDGAPDVVWVEVNIINVSDPDNPIGYTTPHVYLFAE